MKISKAFSGSMPFGKFINNNNWYVIKFNFRYSEII